MTGTRKSDVPDVYPMAKHPKEQKGGIVEIPPFSVGPAGLEPAPRCRIPEIVEPCGKIRRRRDDILTTIRLGHSNAGIEAFNNKIKVTIRMTYGFRGTDNLIAMIKLRCSGPPIHLPTPIL